MLGLAWMDGSGVDGSAGLECVPGLADRERHAYLDKKCDAFFVALRSIVCNTVKALPQL